MVRFCFRRKAIPRVSQPSAKPKPAIVEHKHNNVIQDQKTIVQEESREDIEAVYEEPNRSFEFSDEDERYSSADSDSEGFHSTSTGDNGDYEECSPLRCFRFAPGGLERDTATTELDKMKGKPNIDVDANLTRETTQQASNRDLKTTGFSYDLQDDDSQNIILKENPAMQAKTPYFSRLLSLTESQMSKIQGCQPSKIERTSVPSRSTSCRIQQVLSETESFGDEDESVKNGDESVKNTISKTSIVNEDSSLADTLTVSTLSTVPKPEHLELAPVLSLDPTPRVTSTSLASSNKKPEPIKLPVMTQSEMQGLLLMAGGSGSPSSPIRIYEPSTCKSSDRVSASTSAGANGTRKKSIATRLKLLGQRRGRMSQNSSGSWRLRKFSWSNGDKGGDSTIGSSPSIWSKISLRSSQEGHPLSSPPQASASPLIASTSGTSVPTTSIQRLAPQVEPATKGLLAGGHETPGHSYSLIDQIIASVPSITSNSSALLGWTGAAEGEHQGNESFTDHIRTVECTSFECSRIQLNHPDEKVDPQLTIGNESEETPMENQLHGPEETPEKNSTENRSQNIVGNATENRSQNQDKSPMKNTSQHPDETVEDLSKIQTQEKQPACESTIHSLEKTPTGVTACEETMRPEQGSPVSITGFVCSPFTPMTVEYETEEQEKEESIPAAISLTENKQEENEIMVSPSRTREESNTPTEPRQANGDKIALGKQRQQTFPIHPSVSVEEKTDQNKILNNLPTTSMPNLHAPLTIPPTKKPLNRPRLQTRSGDKSITTRGTWTTISSTRGLQSTLSFQSEKSSVLYKDQNCCHDIPTSDQPQRARRRVPISATKNKTTKENFSTLLGGDTDRSDEELDSGHCAPLLLGEHSSEKQPRTISRKSSTDLVPQKGSAYADTLAVAATDPAVTKVWSRHELTSTLTDDEDERDQAAADDELHDNCCGLEDEFEDDFPADDLDFFPPPRLHDTPTRLRKGRSVGVAGKEDLTGRTLSFSGALADDLTDLSSLVTKSTMTRSVASINDGKPRNKKASENSQLLRQPDGPLFHVLDDSRKSKDVATKGSMAKPSKLFRSRSRARQQHALAENEGDPLFRVLRDPRKPKLQK